MIPSTKPSEEPASALEATCRKCAGRRGGPTCLCGAQARFVGGQSGSILHFRISQDRSIFLHVYAKMPK